MKQQIPYKQLITFLFLTIFYCNNSKAQIPPSGKYNTINYPEDRKAIEDLRLLHDSTIHLNDDYIAVGPEGKVSYGYAEWKKGFAVNGATFKSVTPRPGTYILRIYNGDAAVKNMILDVVFATPAGDVAITVIRTETYIKQDGRWYFVSGQGTKLASEAELKQMGEKVTHNN